ncbi:MAG: matrixin family metalloprotease [Phycisphaerales bacterium]|nr:MAG: matrixin family metalloprotease [Phycisphaerales bacterium]
MCPPRGEVPGGSVCPVGAGAITGGCYDEFPRNPVDLVCYWPTSRWDETDLTWCLSDTVSGINEQAQLDAVERAVAAWEAVSALTFSEAPSCEVADIRISFRSKRHEGDAFRFDGPGGILAHAFFPGSPKPGEVHLDADEDWALEPEEGKFDLFTVVLHEVGHALGLVHSTCDCVIAPCGCVVMGPTYPSSGMKLPSKEDKEAIINLYGSADGTIPPKPISKPDDLASCDPPNFEAFDEPDWDGDKIPDTIEVFVLGTRWFDSDTDGDGVSDFEEVFEDGTPPTVDGTAPDSDSDGLPDSDELEDVCPKRFDSDSDNDGLTDGDEVNFFGTNPCSRDTDGDGDPDSTDPFPTNHHFDRSSCRSAEPCDDGNPCTDDACVGGTCRNTPVDCDDGHNCTTDACDPATGECANDPVQCPEGQECDPATGECGEPCVTDADCDDQNACTTDECEVDGCGNTPVECGQGMSCNPAIGECELMECTNDADCHDAFPCTENSCNLGADPPECKFVNIDASCNDGQFCNGVETCDPTDPDAEEGTGCVVPGDPCTAINKVCDEANNECRDCDNDGECDDGYECTEDDCIAGSCNNAPVDANCDDGLFCTDDDYCDPAHADADETTGCVNETDPCDCAHASDPCEGALGDRKLCTEADGGDCLDCGNDTDCDDGILCTADDCTVATGVCTNSEEDDMCPDPVFCDGPDFCDPTNVDADFNGCVQPGNVCVNPDPICSEADDECQVCISHAECDEFWVGVDAVDCTDARCDAGGACVDFPNDDNCDDGVFCNGAETCDLLLGCQAGVPETCDDAEACTTDSCDVDADACENVWPACEGVGDGCCGPDCNAIPLDPDFDADC